MQQTNLKKSKIGPVVLAILDGWGVSLPNESNAIFQAKTPFYDSLLKNYPFTALEANGQNVGLDEGQMSGSETGHMNLGAGRIVEQDSLKILKSIRNKKFFSNPVLKKGLRHLQKFGGKLHLIGMMSNADNPHSHPKHFQAFLRWARQNNISEVFCHLFTDGRDSYPHSALDYLKKWQAIMRQEQIGKIATLCGRFYAMDRAKNWSRLLKAYDALVFSQGEKFFSAEEAIKNNYRKKLTDEYLTPAVIWENNQSIAFISKNDMIIMFNFRSDRARQFAKLFAVNNLKKIKSDKMPLLKKIPNLFLIALTNFGPDLNIHTIFLEKPLKKTLPMQLKNLRQLYLAEKEKYAHITYFFNGGYDHPVANEKRKIILSPIIKSYAQKPEMAAQTIANYVIKAIVKNKFDFIALNLANADMVGHTGDFEATKKAVSFVDRQLQKMAKIIFQKNGVLIITADHGKADQMFDFYQGIRIPHVFHTKNLVPFILVSRIFKKRHLRTKGILSDVAPTILEILKLPQPKEMTGKSLLISENKN